MQMQLQGDHVLWPGVIRNLIPFKTQSHNLSRKRKYMEFHDHVTSKSVTMQIYEYVERVVLMIGNFNEYGLVGLPLSGPNLYLCN